MELSTEEKQKDKAVQTAQLYISKLVIDKPGAYFLLITDNDVCGCSNDKHQDCSAVFSGPMPVTTHDEMYAAMRRLRDLNFTKETQWNLRSSFDNLATGDVAVVFAVVVVDGEPIEVTLESYADPVDETVSV